jgi:hypothetical protein
MSTEVPTYFKNVNPLAQVCLKRSHIIWRDTTMPWRQMHLTFRCDQPFQHSTQRSGTTNKVPTEYGSNSVPPFHTFTTYSLRSTLILSSSWGFQVATSHYVSTNIYLLLTPDSPVHFHETKYELQLCRQFNISTF